MVFMHASLDTIQFVSPVNETGSPVVAFALISLVMWLIAIFIILRTGPDLGRMRKADVPLVVEPLTAQPEI
jgi:hypothetical protein